MKNIARQLHHIAYVTWDMAKTAEFWTQVMNLKLVGHVSLPKVPSTGEDYPYMHMFFSLEDGSDLAFFEVRNVTPSNQEVGVSSALKHLSFEVATEAELQEYCQRLKAHNIAYIGPEEDSFNRCIYFFDPNQIKLKLALTLRKPGEKEAVEARQEVERWLNEKTDSQLPSGISSMII